MTSPPSCGWNIADKLKSINKSNTKGKRLCSFQFIRRAQHLTMHFLYIFCTTLNEVHVIIYLNTIEFLMKGALYGSQETLLISSPLSINSRN